MSYIKYSRAVQCRWLLTVCGVLFLVGCGGTNPPGPVPRAMLQPVATGWQAEPLITIGTAIDDYLPPGNPDGLGIFTRKNGPVTLLVNQELHADAGAEYRLANGTRLRGARISRIELDPRTRQVLQAGLAYDTVYDRTGQPVTRAAQLNETGADSDGLTSLCSARAVYTGQYHFEDDVFFSGEEVSPLHHPHGGTMWALDVKARTLWPVNGVGRGAWENVTPLQHPDPAHIALLASSDMVGAPLYLYIGNKGGAGVNDFPDRNGLRDGALYCWRADDGAGTPRDFHGNGAAHDGHWVALTVRGTGDVCRVGEDCDAQGYLDSDALQQQAVAQGCFSFSRLEDLHNNPVNPIQAAFVSTGHHEYSEQDTWGKVYLVDNDLGAMTARLRILRDNDTLSDSGRGIRNPDNLTWAGDGMLYVQEDAADKRFAEVSPLEAGIWQLDPVTGAARRIAVIDRSAVWPPTASDSHPWEAGVWESSGIIDVTGQIPTAAGETLLLATVQAHTLTGGAIAERELVDGGQILWLDYRPGVQ